MFTSRRFSVIEANGPWALRRWKRVKEACSSWGGENRFTSGFQLRTARNANTTTISRCHHRGGLPAGPAAAGPAPPPNPSQLQPGKGPPTTQRRKESLIAEKAIKIGRASCRGRGEGAAGAE